MAHFPRVHPWSAIGTRRPGVRRLLAGLACALAAACGNPGDPNLEVTPGPVAGRDSDRGVVIRWPEAPAQRRYRVYASTDPQRFDESAPLAEFVTPGGGGMEIRLPGVDRQPRPYFLLEDAQSGARLTLAERLLPLEEGINFRDYGGYATQDGRHVRWGMLYRSGQLGDLTPADVGYVQSLGLTLVCDFRSPSERTASPSRLPENPAPEVLSLAIGDDTIDPQELQDRILSGDLGDLDLAALLEQGNRSFATDFRDRYATLLRRLAAPGGLPSLIHCTGGKDRTGFGAALVLRALGVPPDRVEHDFLLTNLYQGPAIERALMLIRWTSLFRTDPEAVRPALGVRPSYLAAAFEAIDQEYGDFPSYLRRGLGLTEAELESLRERLLE